jgi:electron transfer flavoprotein alpha subunit
MASGVLIFAEQREGKFRKVAFELLNIGKQIADKLGGPLSAVVVGKGIKDLASSLGKYGAQKVYVIDGDQFALYSTEAYASAVAEAAKKADAAVLLTGNTAMGKDLTPRVAAKLGVGMATDCTALEVEGGKLIATRPVYSGKCYLKVEFAGTPAVASVRPNTYPTASEAGGTAELVEISVSVEPKAKVKEVIKTGEGKIELTEAERIVSGGRGIKDKANFKILEELASVIKAAVGASRAAVDSGYATVDMQV